MMYPVYCDSSLLEKDLSQKNYCVIGDDTGVGFETAKQLAKQGASVFFASHDLERSKRLIAAFEKKANRPIDLVAETVDLMEGNSLLALIDRIKTKVEILDGLINHADYFGKDMRLNSDGFEAHFFANYLSQYLLIHHMLPLLKRSPYGRVINASSAVHDHGVYTNKTIEIDFNDSQYKNKPYDCYEAYAQSKLAVIMFTRQLASILEGEGSHLTTVSIHPGLTMNRAMTFNSLWSLLSTNFDLLRYGDTWSCAQTALHCCLDVNMSRYNGEFFSSGIGSRLYRQGEQFGGWPRRSPNQLVYMDDQLNQLSDLTRQLLQSYL